LWGDGDGIFAWYRGLAIRRRGKEIRIRAWFFLSAIVALEGFIMAGRYFEVVPNIATAANMHVLSAGASGTGPFGKPSPGFVCYSAKFIPSHIFLTPLTKRPLVYY